MKFLKFKTLNSTNTWALDHFDELENLTAVCADSQTNGRGRFNRVWVSQDCGENICLSFVLKPENKKFLANLTQYLCVVTAKTLETYGVEPEIKWPNDVLVDGKKICGILCEAFLKHNAIKGVVLGIGVNLNMDKDLLKNIEKPATSLNIETGKKIDRDAFLNLLTEEFLKNYENAVEKGFASFERDYLQRINFLGKKVYLTQRDNAPKEEFFAQKIDENGSLVVKTADGLEKTVFSGDLIL